jgi:hypothetical protein
VRFIVENLVGGFWLFCCVIFAILEDVEVLVAVNLSVIFDDVIFCWVDGRCENVLGWNERFRFVS